MHLKNWSLITRDDKVRVDASLRPSQFDDPKSKNREELALPLRGKKSNLQANDFWRYLAVGRLAWRRS